MESSQNQSEFLYRPEDKPKSLKDTIIYSLQWVFIMFYPVIWGYSIVGVGIELTPQELGAYMARVVLMIGVSTLSQLLAGHQLSMVSGPNIIPSLAIVSAFTIGGKEYALQSFNAYIIAGIIIAVLGLVGIIGKISLVWTPLVTGSMLMMIGLTTSFTGMQMIATHGANWLYLVGVSLALLCGWLSIKGKGLLSTIPVMLIIIVGYAVFIASGNFKWELVNIMPTFSIPQIFPYGLNFPPIDLILVMVIVNLFSAINMYGNLQGYTGLLDIKLTQDRERKSMTVFGIIEGALTAVFGVPSTVAMGENMGFLMLTKIASKFFLLIASIIFIILSFFGKVGGFMAAMPEPVAGAVLLGVASTLIGMGAGEFKNSTKFETREIFIVGFSIFFALGTTGLPQEFFDALPRLVSTLLNNSVILVILLVVILEQLIFRKTIKNED